LANEFDEACNHRLTQCQQAEEAEQLREFRMWWDLLSQLLNPPGAVASAAVAASETADFSRIGVYSTGSNNFLLMAFS
jgi:hypothetical protein